MLTTQLETYLEAIISETDYGGNKYQKGMRSWISQKRSPMPEKGTHGKDVYATHALQRAAKMKQSKKMEVSPDERQMLLNGISKIVNDAYDYSGETEKMARKSLRKFGLNPGRERRRSKAKHQLMRKVMAYDAKKASVIPPKE
jgi:hypothetical protein